MKHFFTTFALFAAFAASAQCPVVTGVVTDVSCAGGSNGSINLTVTDGAPFQTSTKGLLLSEIHANPTGTDAPFEFVELIATKTIDFSVTPYTVIFSNNGTANANGWIAGGALTYAFSITSGTVDAGDVVYVGGTSMIPQNNRLRTINTSNTAGDGGIGNASASGSIGNGGSNADGIAVFDVPVASITSATVPIDAIMWGTGTGAAVVSAGTLGYELPVNDHYSGGKLQTTSFLGPDQASVTFLAATGAYNVQTNTFTTPRTWSNTPTFTDLSSSVTLSGLYNFAWSSTQTTEDISGLTPGNYLVIVSDAVNCNTPAAFVVSEPTVLNVSMSVTPADCGNANGIAEATVTGGTPGYTYLWMPGNFTTDSIGGLTAGTYTLNVTDANGCTKIDSAIVTAALNTLTSFTNTLCHSANGAGSGSIVVSVLNGTGPYAHLWTPNVSTSSSATGLAAGTYIINTSDQGGCTAIDTVVIQSPSEIISMLSAVNPSCANSCDGSASAMVNGGTPGYTYFWSSGCTTINCTNLCEGCDTLFVTDMNGCRDTTVICLIDPPALVATATSTPTSCYGPCDGSVNVVSSGGTGGVTYAWSNLVCSTPTCTNVCAGTYTVTVTDANGCIDTDIVAVNTPPPAALMTFGPDTTICDPATITICAPGGFMSYSWSNGVVSQCVIIDTTVCISVLAMDASGCMSADTICITDDICTGIADSNADQTLKAYPNPGNGLITLESAGNGNIQIWNSLGEIVYAQRVTNQKTEINLTNQPAGVYMLTLSKENGEMQSLMIVVE